MRVLSTIAYQKGLVSVLVCILVMTILLAIQFTPIASASSGGAHFSMEPSFAKPYNLIARGYFIYTSIPGAQISDSIHIKNVGSRRGHLHLYAADATTAPTSGTMFPPEKVPPHQVGTWIKLSRQDITLDPEQSLDVAFTVTIPRHVRPGDHGGGIIGEELDTPYLKKSVKSNDVTIGIHTTLALGVLVTLPGSIVESLHANNIRSDEVSHYQRLLIAMENTGTQLLYPSGKLQVFDEQEKLLQNLQMQLSTFIPQTAINYPINVQYKPLPPGRRYTAMLHLNYGHGHTLHYKTTFLVPFPDKGPLTKFIQNLGAPVVASPGNVFSLLTPWHYMIAGSILFLILSSLFFWKQQISKIQSYVRSKKRG